MQPDLSRSVEHMYHDISKISWVSEFLDREIFICFCKHLSIGAALIYTCYSDIALFEISFQYLCKSTNSSFARCIY